MKKGGSKRRLILVLAFFALLVFLIFYFKFGGITGNAILISESSSSSFLEKYNSCQEIDTGGSNYLTYNMSGFNHLDSSSQVYLKHVISNYNENPAEIKEQLNSMYNKGQRVISLMLYYADFNNTDSFFDNNEGLDSYKMFINSNSGELPTPQKENLLNLLNDIKDQGYETVILRFVQERNMKIRYHYEYPDYYGPWTDELSIRSWNFMNSTISTIENDFDKDNLIILYDLGAEEGGRNAVGSSSVEYGSDLYYQFDANFTKYNSYVWKNFVDNYGKENSIGFSTSGGNDWELNASLALYQNLTDTYSEDYFPDYYAWDIYKPNLSFWYYPFVVDWEGQNMGYHEGLAYYLQEYNQQDKQFIILESFYTDENIYNDLVSLKEDNNFKLCFIIQWPITTTSYDSGNTAIDMDYPLNYSYFPNGFCSISLTNTSFSSWSNVSSCRINNTILQQRNKTQYDANNCGEIANQTFYEYQEIACDYCTPSLYNQSTSWSNIICLETNQMNQTRNLTQTDSNGCYALTSLESDYVAPTVFSEYRLTENCDYCTPSLYNTSWSSYQDYSSCYSNNTLVQVRNKTQYDLQNCGEVSNQTFYDYKVISCVYSNSSSGSSSGGSGGGGGSSSGNSYSITQTQLQDTYSLKLSTKDKLTFTFNSQDHSVAVGSIGVDFANVVVSSNPQNKTLKVGESWEVDLDEDSSKDIKVTLNNLTSYTNVGLSILELPKSSVKTEVNLTLKNKSSDSNLSSNTNQTLSPEEKTSRFNLMIIVLIIVFVIVLGAIVYLMRK